jgi:N-acetylglucosamine-6-phosphate deacetylase
MIVLAGADLVLPDGIVGGGALVIDDGRMIAVESTPPVSGTAERLDLRDHYVLPGFVDIHIHGLEGHEGLDGHDALQAIAGRLPRFGVTAFCPTSVACDPITLAGFLQGIGSLRAGAPHAGARVLPAHLESNFINPDYRGGQPAEYLRLPPDGPQAASGRTSDFSSHDILEVMRKFAADIGIVTLAPELPGAIDLITRLSAGHLVSLGHSGASFEDARQAIRAGARHATHLFNRMAPAHHREPGLVGAVLSSEEIAAEVIGDGQHVHPAIVRATVAAKQPSRVMAVTDATAAAGLPDGARARQGHRTVTATGGVARLDDGTIAGGTTTMDRVFGTLVGAAGLSLVDAAAICSTTPARELGLTGLGVIAAGAIADLVVLDRHFRVRHTFVAGQPVYSA